MAVLSVSTGLIALFCVQNVIYFQNHSAYMVNMYIDARKLCHTDFTHEYFPDPESSLVNNGMFKTKNFADR